MAITNINNVTIEATIIKADGTKVNLGKIAELKKEEKEGNK